MTDCRRVVDPDQLLLKALPDDGAVELTVRDHHDGDRVYRLDLRQVLDLAASLADAFNLLCDPDGVTRMVRFGPIVHNDSRGSDGG